MFNHPETAPSKYLDRSRSGARYFASLRLLERAKELNPSLFTKSGMMAGLGEQRNERLQVMDDMRAADVDFLTLGLNIGSRRRSTMRSSGSCPLEMFAEYAAIGLAEGFLLVSSSPLTLFLASRRRRLRPAQSGANGAASGGHRR